MTMADILLTAAARAALEELPSRQARAVDAAISHIPDEPGRPLNLPGAPPSAPFLAAEPEDPAAPVVIYRRALPEEGGDWLVVSLMAPADYHAVRRAEQTLSSAPSAVRERVASAVQDSVSPADQLIKALRQLRARVIDARTGQHGEKKRASEMERLLMLQDALAIATRWGSSRRPPSPPPGAGLRELGDYAGNYADALKQDEELIGALQAINPDFSVETIDNAIHVVEKQAWAAERY